MKFVAILPLFLISASAFAEGRYHPHRNAGCEEAGIVFGLLICLLLLFVVVGTAFDVYKMKTDPKYRARSEQIYREIAQKNQRSTREDYRH